MGNASEIKYLIDILFAKVKLLYVSVFLSLSMCRHIGNKIAGEYNVEAFGGIFVRIKI